MIKLYINSLINDMTVVRDTQEDRLIRNVLKRIEDVIFKNNYDQTKSPAKIISLVGIFTRQLENLIIIDKHHVMLPSDNVQWLRLLPFMKKIKRGNFYNIFMDGTSVGTWSYSDIIIDKDEITVKSYLNFNLPVIEIPTTLKRREQNDDEQADSNAGTNVVPK